VGEVDTSRAVHLCAARFHQSPDQREGESGSQMTRAPVEAELVREQGLVRKNIQPVDNHIPYGHITPHRICGWPWDVGVQVRA